MFRYCDNVKILDAVQLEIKQISQLVTELSALQESANENSARSESLRWRIGFAMRNRRKKTDVGILPGYQTPNSKRVTRSGS